MPFPATVLSLLLAAPPITVEAKYSGTSAEEVETAVVLPLEQGVSTIKGVRRASSLASDNRALRRLEPDPQAGPNAVRNAVRVGLSRTRMPDGSLPFLQSAPAEAVELLVLRSKKLDRAALSELAT